MAIKIKEENFFPVISDDVLSLSWKNRYDAIDINDEDEAIFDIILNETREIIGKISFDYFFKSGFSYSGNVGYNIKYRFQNKHYATRALKLLRTLLLSNKYSGDKSLYLATKIDNIRSQKVILNNNGNLIYDGKVPINEPLNFMEGIKKVKVYKIDM